MRAWVELRHELDPVEWGARHRAGRVPDATPYGLGRMREFGVETLWRRPVHNKVVDRVNRTARARAGSVEWLDALAATNARQLRGCDVVLCWDESTGVPAARLARMRLRVPVATGVVWLSDPSLVPRPMMRAAVRGLPSARLVWAQSTGMLPALLNIFALDPRRLRYVPLGVDVDFFAPDCGGGVEPGLVASAGNDRHRDHPAVVRAVAAARRQAPHAHVEIATRLPVDVPACLGAARRVRDEREVAHLYTRAQVVAVATRPNVHASGLTVTLEAMASGRPVVITANPGLAEYVVHGETGLLVPPGDDAAFAAAVTDLLRDPDRCREMGAAGRRRVVQTFTTRHQAALLAELVRDAV